MTVPEGAQYSDDGNYWWDGEAWQAVRSGGAPDVSTSMEVGTRSDDGAYWWDGVAWQPVEADPLAAAVADTPMDWNEFPEIARLLHYGEDIDVYLTDLGIDPNIMCDDEPFANA